MYLHSLHKVSLSSVTTGPAPHLLRVLHGGLVEDAQRGRRALPVAVPQRRGRGGQHLPHWEVVQVHMEIGRNLPVAFYVKQGQSDKERLDLDKTKQSRPSLGLKLLGQENAAIKEETTRPVCDCCYKLLPKCNSLPPCPVSWTSCLVAQMTLCALISPSVLQHQELGLRDMTTLQRAHLKPRNVLFFFNFSFSKGKLRL